MPLLMSQTVLHNHATMVYTRIEIMCHLFVDAAPGAIC